MRTSGTPHWPHHRAGENVEYGDNNDPMGGGAEIPTNTIPLQRIISAGSRTPDIATFSRDGKQSFTGLYCFDQDFGVGLRGLKFVRTGSQNYWINFRQRKTVRPTPRF